MYIQSARDRFKSGYKVHENEYNPYFEGYLNKKDKEYITGFDYVVENPLTNYFDNIEDFVDEFDIEGVDLNIARYICNHKEVLEVLKSSIMSFIENDRDMMIVSMIENMNEDEYEQIKAKVNADYESKKG